PSPNRRAARLPRKGTPMTRPAGPALVRAARRPLRVEQLEDRTLPFSNGFLVVTDPNHEIITKSALDFLNDDVLEELIGGPDVTAHAHVRATFDSNGLLVLDASLNVGTSFTGNVGMDVHDNIPGVGSDSRNHFDDHTFAESS